METKDIRQLLHFNAPPFRIYEFLTQEKKHAMLTDAETELPLAVGGMFTFFGGAINGTIKELVPDKKIVWEWFCYVHGWPTEHMSEVCFELAEGEAGSTTLTFTQKNIPQEACELIEEGWEERYWQPLRKLLDK